MMFKISLVFIILSSLFNCSDNSAGKEDDKQEEKGWQLVWQDEFNGQTLDSTKWNYELGGHGWGNNERQFYTDRTVNTYIRDSMLVIEARKEYYEEREYTSARLTTKSKGDWLYGKIEVRAKLPEGQGVWPAIWMMPTDFSYGGWAASGEIDIMELLGHEPSNVYGTLHYGGESPDNVHSGTKYTLPSGNKFSEDFHTFTLEWEEREMRWYVDGQRYQTQNEWHSFNGDYPAPFDKRFHLLLNVAVGGNWPGYPDETTVFPQRMYLDYVRVYRFVE